MLKYPMADLVKLPHSFSQMTLLTKRFRLTSQCAAAQPSLSTGPPLCVLRIKFVLARKFWLLLKIWASLGRGPRSLAFHRRCRSNWMAYSLSLSMQGISGVVARTGE